VFSGMLALFWNAVKCSAVCHVKPELQNSKKLLKNLIL
jgi:hypothetical protein